MAEITSFSQTDSIWKEQRLLHTGAIGFGSALLRDCLQKGPLPHWTDRRCHGTSSFSLPSHSTDRWLNTNLEPLSSIITGKCT